uniref:Nuclear RNA export factor 3 n=1 Tax=Molossus molossus TaxID=27622 RepID=A0A7J8J748_MOLMO|nr:nuclear RNA export factor 3 [Molossus molossus]
MGHNTQGNTIYRRSSWGIYRRRYISLSEQVRSGIPSSYLQQQDGDASKSDGHVDTRVRYAPYAIPRYHRRAYFQTQNHTHVNMEREQNPPETKLEEKRQGETSRKWFKITIPFGIKYEEKWLLNLIQRQCSIPFTPVEFHYDKMQAQFFVENVSIALALQNVNGKIWDKNNEKVKSAEGLDQGKGLEPGEMSANINPLCTTLPDNSTNISSILELFPKLSCLDGQEPPPLTNFGIEAQKMLPSYKGSFFGSDTLKSLIMQFLQQYYLIYDSGDRHCLLCAYHDEACFSMTIPFIQGDPAPSSLFVYFKDNRNMKNLKDPNLRFQLLKHRKHDIVSSLCVLPKTQHDLSSFLVDMWFQSERMLCFSVKGVFKEVAGRSQGSVRAFTRTFFATPASNCSLCIMNDELFVKDAIPKEAQSLYSIQLPTPTTSSMTPLSQEQQERVQVFAIQSGMSLQWSQKCLHDHHWDFTRAAQVVALLKTKDMIPEEVLPQADPDS